MIDTLEKISKALDDDANNIVEYVKKALSEGTLKEPVFESTFFLKGRCFKTLETRPCELRGKPGVYVIMIDSDFDLSLKEVQNWNSLNKGAGFKTYSAKHIKCGDCLYLGSGKSIYARCYSHFKDNIEGSGLHLTDRRRRIALEHIIVYPFPLKEEYKPFFAFLVSQTEKRLHLIIYPLAGSSRV